MKEKGKRKNRILYCSWLAENRRVDREERTELTLAPFIDFDSIESYDPEELDLLILTRQGEERSARVDIAVRAAVDQLTEDEREFLFRFYHMGQTYRELSEKSGRTIHSLESLHSRARRKLRKYLAEFVAAEFGIRYRAGERCAICNSEWRAEIDALLAVHSPAETWRKEIRILKNDFGLTSVTPQTIIGHRQYH